jgi:N5-(cytidine 5'-diphosphoramidyl)-L-glutamine hydrolase
MIVLISQRHTRNIHGDWIDSLENNYILYFEKYGISLIPVSNIERKVEQIFKDFNPAGVILTGGGDVDPELYGEAINNNLSVSKDRDETESMLLWNAIRNKIPVLGICRGMQFINVYFGGSLVQYISETDTMKKHVSPGIHNIKIVHDELLRELSNKADIPVNSYHNTGVLTNMLGTNLQAFSVLEEISLVEGLYHNQYPIAGIEWHPERTKPNEELDEILVKAFINKTLFWGK